jgi:ribonuclease HI
VTTTLRTLAARVPVEGPRIEPYPEIPVGAPTWNGQVQTIPRQKEWDYHQVTNTFAESCREGTTTNIFCNGVISNRGRADGKQVGATSAVLYHEGKEWGHMETVLGETVTDSDTMIRALKPALEMLTNFLTATPPQAHKPTLIFSHASATISKSLNAAPHDEQGAAIRHLNLIGELLTLYPNANIKLLWLPGSAPFVGFKRAKQLALEAIRTADLTNIQGPQTIKSQKKTTKDAAIAKWTERWHELPRTSLAYRTALTSPPDGKPHATFQPRPPQTRGEDNGTAKPFSRLTHSTLYRFITGHAFTGEYTQRFFPPHTPDQVACPCGERVQTVEHILLECRLYNAARRKHLTAHGRPRTLSQLFAHPERVQEVLRFLEETGACAKPRAVWEPG